MLLPLNLAVRLVANLVKLLSVLRGFLVVYAV